VTNSGDVGYLPQDPRTGDLDVLARDRILSARGLDVVIRDLRETEGRMASAGDGPAAAHAVRWSATPGRAGPHPVQRRADAAARRAHEPPGRRLDHLA